MASKRKNALLIVGPIAIIGLGYFVYKSIFFVSTDNAQIQARTIMLSPKVSGFIKTVSVEENQKVKKDQILIQLDDRDYQNNLNQVKDEKESLMARAQDASSNFKRIGSLFKSGAVTRQQFDSSQALSLELSHKMEGIESQIQQAELNIEYARIRAPSDGSIAKRAAEVGMLAASGTPLIGFVSDEDRWVIANFKETEIKDIKIGKDVDVEVDSLPNDSFAGVIDSISSATGATFTLLPPDNATGNFTKVVQRVPVKIKFKSLRPEDIDRLQVGLSVEVRVRK